jgi:serine/threonine-protein kinase RsbW
MSGIREKILASVAPEDFIGRTGELDALLRHAKAGETGGLLLLSAPALGASELLRQTFDQLFYERGDAIPFYFSIKKSDKIARSAALRFAQSFLQQAVAFRRQDKKILDAAPDVCELERLAPASDAFWVDRLIETCQTESKLNDERAFIKNCLSAPLRAAGSGARVFVMIDDLDETAYFSGEFDFLEELSEIYTRAGISFVFAAKRRFPLACLKENSKTLHLEPLSFGDAGLLAENLANRGEIKINKQTRDLIAAQFDGKPGFIKLLFRAAGEKKINLSSFQRVERVYADEVFGGGIARFYDAVFEQIAPNVETQKNLLGLLYDALTIERGKMPVESWQKRSGLNERDFYRVINLLNANEIVRITSNQIEAAEENRVLSDYLRGRFRLETIMENRALVVGEMLSEFLKRAPQMMARFYRKSAAIGLRELLSAFDRQEIPAALLDYSLFRDELKGAPVDEIIKSLRKAGEKIHLPQIVYTAHTSAFYPPIEKVIETERSAVALGFVECDYTDEDEIVWIAAEIDSKLEASRETAEFWCDRLEMVALMCNFSRYKLWLVAPEGFAPEAVEVLKQRNALASSKKQVDLLIKFLDLENLIGEKTRPNEYEMVVPMGEDTELIAAQTVEEIARRHNFAPKAINQIKTALVEACINASEHSRSPDRKIYQKFAVEDDKIIITISNRGIRLTDKKAREFVPDEGRRGWGLSLMKTLMDEVKFEQTDDGTRISMVKYLR